MDSCQPACQPSRILNGFSPPRTCTIHLKFDSGGGLVGAKNNIWTTGVLAFWTCSEANLKKMVAYNVPLLPQRLDQAFNSNAFRQYSADSRTSASLEDTNNDMPMAW